MAKPLFGGAMAISLPGPYSDVSAFRQVPDNQEVFSDVDSGASFIVELVERKDVADSAAAGVFLADLLEYEEAVVAPPGPFQLPLPLGAPGAASSGGPPHVGGAACTAAIAKYKEAVRNRVLVLLAVVRLPSVDTDVLITHNVPLFIAPSSSAGASAAPGVAGRSLSGEGEEATVAAAAASFGAAVASLRVLQWSLFNGGG
jgi:hypothetical protein